MDGRIRRYGVALCIWAFVVAGLTPINAVNDNQEQRFDTIICKELIVEGSNGYSRILLTADDYSSSVMVVNKNKTRAAILSCSDKTDETVVLAIADGELQGSYSADSMMLAKYKKPIATVTNMDGFGNIHLYNAFGRYTEVK